MHIVNLSDPNTSYRSSVVSSETFTNILNSLKIDPKKMKGLEAITRIQTALQYHTEKVVENLAEAELKLCRLEEEVSELQLQSIQDNSENFDLDCSREENEKKANKGRGRGKCASAVPIDNSTNMRTRRVKN